MPILGKRTFKILKNFPGYTLDVDDLDGDGIILKAAEHYL